MRHAWHAGIEQYQVELAKRDELIERSRRKGIVGTRKRGAHHLARVVIAGNAGKPQLQWYQQTRKMSILFDIRRIGEVARDHHKVRRRIELIQAYHAALQRLGSIDVAVS